MHGPSKPLKTIETNLIVRNCVLAKAKLLHIPELENFFNDVYYFFLVTADFLQLKSNIHRDGGKWKR